MKTICSLLLILSFTVSESISQHLNSGTTTFVMVRHAEKVDDSHNPELSGEGYERVARLNNMLEKIEFDAVYSTPLIRTMETARPISERHQLTIQEYDHRNPEDVVEGWIQKHRGQHVLVSGHSNSTPTFANALMGEEYFINKFDESDYGNLLIITIAENDVRNILHLRF